MKKKKSKKKKFKKRKSFFIFLSFFFFFSSFLSSLLTSKNLDIIRFFFKLKHFANSERKAKSGAKLPFQKKNFLFLFCEKKK